MTLFAGPGGSYGDATALSETEGSPPCMPHFTSSSRTSTAGWTLPGASQSRVIQSSNQGQACQAPPIPLWPGAWARKLSGTDQPTDRLTDGQRHR